MTPPRITPAQLRARADQLERKALEHLDAGRNKDARECVELAIELRGAAEGMESVLGVDRRSGNVQATNVTAAQQTLARRGRGVAKAHAHNALLRAITDDKEGPGGTPRWGSGTVYCRKRLRIAPSSFTGYMDGTTPCPRHVDEKVRADFPQLSWTWKGGIAD